MDGDALPAAAQLMAWRTHGADRMDPLRFGFIEALAARTRTHEGEARRLLEARLSGLIEAYAGDLVHWPARDLPKAGDASPTVSSSPLRELVTALQRPAHEAAAPEDVVPAPPVPAMLGEARRLWTHVRTESQRRASLDDLPADAGPLNSGMLVHRALHLMQAVSPGYLQHFIAYADTLSSLERLQQGLGPLTPQAADGGKPASHSRTRKRRA